MRAKVITVTPDSSRELKERVYRLRYQIYVEELGHKLENDERMLHDKYDDYSTSFLLEADGEDIGTILRSRIAQDKSIG
jgi:N-acyl-L-homoserine lactone synthetase